MFQIHPEEKLVEWTRQLRYFRYVKDPLSAHCLMACWQFNDLNELQRFFSSIGFKIRVFDKKPEQRVKGVRYSSEESFITLIPGTNWWEQPGHVVIKDEPVYIDCYNGVVKIAIFHGRGEVFSEQFESAIRLEDKLPALKLRNFMPPVEKQYCFSESTYPECFRGNGFLSNLIVKFKK